MENADDWKKKYFKSLDKLEALEEKTKSWEDLENLLRLAMNRVAVAAQGVDPVLDRHLDLLRNAVRSGKYPELEIIIEDISRTVKRIDEQRHQTANTGDTPAQLLNSLLEQLQFPNSYKSRVKTLKKSIRSLKDMQSVETMLHELAELINDTTSISQPVSPPAGENKSLFGKLFNNESSNKEKPGNDSVELEDLKNQLVNFLQTYPASAPRDALVKQLRTCEDLTSISECVSQINAKLASSSVQTHDSIPEPSDKNDIAAPTAVQNKSEQTLDSIPEPPDKNDIVAATAAAQNKSDQVAASNRYHDIQWGESEQQVIGNFCLRLLEALHFPDELLPHTQALRDTITKGFNMIETGSVIQKIADLITAARVRVEKEKQELQDFLQHLTEHLQDIDRQLTGAENHRRANVENSLKLDAAVQEQVNIIEISVNNASQLSQLKQDIQQRLITIRDHFTEHRKLEEQHQKQLEQALAESNLRLSNLEKESQQLRHRINEKHQQAIHDTLTGVYNRLAYEERIEQEYARWKRYQQPLTLVVFDIDHFKNINDSYGHNAGDKALKLIAKTLDNNLRESDFLARYGGEEFVALLPHTELNDAIIAANKLRLTVEDCEFHYKQKSVRITISCGASQFKQDDTVETVFQRADQALYQAKKNGRNRCESSP